MDTDIWAHTQTYTPIGHSHTETWKGPKQTWTDMNPESDTNMDMDTEKQTHIETDPSWVYMNFINRSTHSKTDRDRDIDMNIAHGHIQRHRQAQ